MAEMPAGTMQCPTNSPEEIFGGLLRRRSARRDLPAIRRAEAERLDGEATHARIRPVDPYGLRWRTTPDGASLETIACLLSAAIEIFEPRPAK